MTCSLVTLSQFWIDHAANVIQGRHLSSIASLLSQVRQGLDWPINQCQNPRQSRQISSARQIEINFWPIYKIKAPEYYDRTIFRDGN